jgi:hypothetical protein
MGRADGLGEEVTRDREHPGRSRSALPRRHLLLRDDLVAQADTLVADVDARAGDQPAHFAFRLSTERALRRAIDPLRGSRTLVEHGPKVGLLAAGWGRSSGCTYLTVVGGVRHAVRLRSQLGTPARRRRGGVREQDRVQHRCGRFAGAGDGGDWEPRLATRCQPSPAPRPRSRQARIATTRPPRTVNTS